jgi:hypothetical protein
MVHGVHLFVLSIHKQADLEPMVVDAVARNGANFSQCSMEWGVFPQARGSGY